MILSILISFAFAGNPEKGLPFEPDTTHIKMTQIKLGNSVILDFLLNLPSTEKLNRGAGSYVGVYERTKGANWVQTEKIDLNTVLQIGDTVRFSKKVELVSKDSEVAVFATILHCGKAPRTPCFIQGFQGITARAKTSNQTLPFHIEQSAVSVKL